jgi:hypothetical protein
MIKYFEVKDSHGHRIEININTHYAGTLEPKEDGYWDWYPQLNNPGYIPAYILRSIADKLDELNKEWDNVVVNQL